MKENEKEENMEEEKRVRIRKRFGGGEEGGIK